MAKYIFVTGGVVSSLGKGVSAASLGILLKERGLSIFMQKFDPYLNVDPGTMSPYQHGEVFVTIDGAETDLDLGHYERFLDVELSQSASISQGRIYSELLENERRGDYLGATVQVIPHVTDMIKAKVFKAAEESNADVIITEIGGTVGDIESLPFIEAIRQLKQDRWDDVLVIHNTLVPYLSAAKEIKTKPTQHSVKELRGLGLQPDVLVLRTETPIEQDVKNKIAMFCGVQPQAVIEARDAKVLYQLPFEFQKQKLDDLVVRKLALPVTKDVADLTAWSDLIQRIETLDKTVEIALVGKYVELKDAYISVYESLDHAGYAFGTAIKIRRIAAEDLTRENAAALLAGVDGIVVPGGFGDRGIEGKIEAIRFAREQQVPFLGICLGMQLAAIEFARNVLGMQDANSREFDLASDNFIIDAMDDFKTDMLGGTQRLGNYACTLTEGSKVAQAYGTTEITERHRHRFEFNSDYREQFEANGMHIVGTNPATNLVEAIELADHPYFVAVQFHPEFSSRPLRPQPLFKKLIEEAGIFAAKK